MVAPISVQGRPPCPVTSSGSRISSAATSPRWGARTRRWGDGLHPGAAGHRRAHGLCHHRRRLSRLHRGERSRDAHFRHDGCAERASADPVPGGAEGAADDRGGALARGPLGRHQGGLPRDGPPVGQDRHLLRGALLGHGRGSAGCQFSRASRRPSSTFEGEKAILAACKRCYASLFTDRAISYRENKGFEHIAGGAVGGRAADGALRYRGLGSDVLARYRIGLRQGRADQRGLGAGENVVQGASRRTSTWSSSRSSTGRGWCPSWSGRWARKEIKMIYAQGGQATKNVKTSKEERGKFVLSRGGDLRSRADGGDDRGSLRLPDGHGMGAQTAIPASSTSCRRGPRRCRAGPTRAR